jgi:S-adenosylmethionine:tRNA ribosyltransferase-isomerase
VDAPDYELPEEAIAQVPLARRDAARLLDATPCDGGVVHRHVSDLPDILAPDDVLVVNNSRVIPARLRLAKPTGGSAEILLLEPESQSPGSQSPGSQSPGSKGPGSKGIDQWRALVRPGRRLPPGTLLAPEPGGEPVLEVGDRLAEGVRLVRFLSDAPGVMAAHGTVALPPYIRTPLSEPDRYQTVFADRPGSVAAPTAGLHLTPDLLAGCRAKGVAVHTVDLAVGLGTFRPITASSALDHVMHEEAYVVPEETWEACSGASRVVAIGTTTMRALESTAASGELTGRTGLFIRPGYRFSVVDLLMTNFHQPRSTLLLLLEAFAGPRWRDLYQLALGEGYRFLSFGDAMVVARA